MMSWWINWRKKKGKLKSNNNENPLRVTKSVFYGGDFCFITIFIRLPVQNPLDGILGKMILCCKAGHGDTGLLFCADFKVSCF